MSYETHDLVQGSPQWAAHRDGCYNASDAGTALGVNPHKSRQDLVRELASGETKDIDLGTQRRFDDGHRFEQLARPLMEAIIGEELFSPTASIAVQGLARRLSASFDGTTIADTVNVEHKTLSESLSAALDRGEIPEQYQPQMEQGMMINGAARCLFMASKWDENNQLIAEKHAWYESNSALRGKIIPAWKQIEEDVANYQHIEVAPVAVAAPTMQLPALSIQVNGSITLIDNLKVFGERLESFIADIDKDPTTDQAFADAEAAIKTLGTAETALEAAKSSALAQTASIDEMTRTVALYANQARTTRLMLEKLVKAKKESIRVDIVQGGRDALAAHIAGLHKRLGKVYPIVPAANFAAVIKGKRTITSLHDAVDTELARAKIEANAIADRIQINLATLQDLAKDYAYLFADAGNMVTKDADDFTALVKTRIADHKAAEEKRLEAEREKIRAEEAAKLQKVEQERLEAARIQQEGIDRAARAKETAAAQKEMLHAGPLTRPEAPVGSQHEAVTSAPHAAPNSSAAPYYPPTEPSSVLIGEARTVAGTQSRPTYAGILKVIADHFGVTEGTADAWIVEYIRPQKAA